MPLTTDQEKTYCSKNDAPGTTPSGNAASTAAPAPASVSRSNRSSLPEREWRIDADGIMRVTAVVLQEGVYPYAAAESAALADQAHPEKRTRIMEYIPAEEMTQQALYTLEGKPLIVDEHSWRNAKNTMQDGLTRGNVAGTPRYDDGCILCDFLINDAETREAVMAGELVEVSSSYTADLHQQSGEWNGQTYDAVQRNFRFNHILLCPPGKGRLGPDVRIINALGDGPPAHSPTPEQARPATGNNNKEEHSMEKNHIIERQIGGSVRKYRFSNAEDAETAREMADESARASGQEADEASSKAEETQAEIAILKATIAELRRQLEEATSQEAIEAKAEELKQDNETIEAIVAQELPEKEGEELKGSTIKNSKTSMADRRKALVQAVMKKNSMPVDDWEQKQFDSAFTALGMAARKNLKARNEALRVSNGGTIARNNNSMDALERMMAPYRKKGDA